MGMFIYKSRSLFHSLIVAAVCIFALNSTAEARLTCDAGLALAWPQDKFEEQVDFAWGGGARIGYSFFEESAAGISLFFDLSYLNYGRERRVEPFSITIPDVFVDVVTDNYMVLFSPGISLGVHRGWFRPYGEIFAGGTYIATRTKIEKHGWSQEEIAASTNFDDFTYNLGLGGGIKVPVYRSPRVGGSKLSKINLSEVLIDVKFTYIKGGEAEYLKKGSITRTTRGNIIYETYLSKTDLFQLRIGCSFRF
ncbi:MAG: hypothetical protein U9P14_12525 [Gemmatimonadota bacterium]|nr:hypothetical protein [Gemmatimonadota bacterium]